MNNEPVAWLIQTKTAHQFTFKEPTIIPLDATVIPLYTQEQLEEARKLGMQQERALWNLSESTQEIMNTHPVKELTDEEIMELAEKHLGAFTEYGCCNTHIEGEIDFARAILRKAQEK